MYGQSTFTKNMSYVFEYINNLFKFVEVYDRKRYGVDLNLQFYYPNYSPKSYEELKQYDQSPWLHKAFGNQFQMYVCYNLDFNPYGITTDGYAECHYGQISENSTREIRPESMAYVEMPKFLLGSVFDNGNPYTHYKNFGRGFLHEIDHQILSYQNDPSWLRGVHKASKMKMEIWNIKGEFLGYDGEIINWNKCTNDSNGKPIYFMVQQDARLF